MDRAILTIRRTRNLTLFALIPATLLLMAFQSNQLTSGHPSLQEWLLPDTPKAPKNNATTPERVALGKMLFFDPRLSRDGSMSCATCHNPVLGWSDGLPTGVGFKGEILGRASPTVINSAYNRIQMWDGRARTLEAQALGPILASVEMNGDPSAIVEWLRETPGYQRAFDVAYPAEGISEKTMARAIAAFERTVISNNSPFDQWVRGDADAMTAQQIRGFRVFLDPDKGNCAVCHQAPNFTDDGFHNLGLASYDTDSPDMGRFAHKPIKVLKGAFKTPTLRDIELTAPYFHDGSANTLAEVVDHYVQGGVVTRDLSPNMKPLNLTEQEKVDLVAYMGALTSPAIALELPLLPVSERPTPYTNIRAKDNSQVLAGTEE